LFSRVRSLYFVTLGEAISSPPTFTISVSRLGSSTHSCSIIRSANCVGRTRHNDKVWYNRHQVAREKIERGETKIVEKETFPVKDHARRPIQRDIWEGALKSAAKVEKKYGSDDLGPWDDFEWGMINGKLSALRWVLGDEWDMLDT
jgi:hypothetical protein